MTSLQNGSSPYSSSNIARTTRGRIALPEAYKHLGYEDRIQSLENKGVYQNQIKL